MTTSPSPAADRARVWAPALATAGGAHFAALWALGGAGWDYLALDGLLVGLALAGGRALFLARTAFPLWLTGVLYLNLQPALLPLRGPILTGELLAADAALFPSPGGGGWPAFFAGHPSIPLDVLAGLAYLLYLLEFFAVFLLLHLRDRPSARQMAWCFFAANVLGIAGYVLLPAAPPWYVLAHGPGPADPAAAPSAAGAARFDALLGIHYFAAFYARSPNVFGAMPSLHVAYPTIAACFLARRGAGAAVAGAAFAAWVAFSAVYLVHHYVLDVVAGAAVGLAAFALVAGPFRATPADGGAT